MFIDDLTANIRLTDMFSGTFDLFDRRANAWESQVEDMDRSIQKATNGQVRRNESLNRWQGPGGRIMSQKTVTDMLTKSTASATVETSKFATATKFAEAAIVSFVPGGAEAISVLGMVGSTAALATIGLAALAVGALVVAKNMAEAGEVLLEQERLLSGLGDAYDVNTNRIVDDMKRIGRGALTESQVVRQAVDLMLEDRGRLAKSFGEQSYGEVADVGRAVALAKGDPSQAGKFTTGIAEALNDGDLRALDNATSGYLDMEGAIDRWILANGRAFGSLTELEREQVLYNELMKESSKWMEQTGLDMETQAERAATLSSALADLKDSWLKAAAESTGLQYFNSELIKFIENTTEANTVISEINKLETFQTGLDAADAAMFADEWERVEEAMKRANTPEGWVELKEAIRLATEEAERLAEVGHGVQPRIDTGSDAGDQFDVAVIKQQDIELGQGDAAVLNDLTRGAAQLGAAIMDIPEMPDISLNMDPEKMREYLDAIEALHPALAVEIQSTREFASSVEVAQEALVIAALRMETGAEKAEALAQAFLGADAGVLDLVAALEYISPSARDAATGLDLVDIALEALKDSAREPVTIDIILNGDGRAIEGITAIENQVTSQLNRLVGTVDPASLDRAYGMMIDDYGDFLTQYGHLQEDNTQLFQFHQEAWLKGNAAFIAEWGQQGKGMVSSEKSRMDEIKSLRGDVTKILGEGATSVSQLDMWDTDLGQYEDKPLESARRLQDVINRGMESPWAEYFDIPAEVLAKGETAVKAWATRLRDDVLNLERPDLIDWEAFDKNFEDFMAGQAAREDTINEAVQRAMESGVDFGGADPEKAIKKFFGIADTDMSGPAGEMAENFVSDLADHNMANDIVDELSDGLDKNAQDIKDTGKSVGGVFGDAFVAEVNEKLSAFFSRGETEEEKETPRMGQDLIGALADSVSSQEQDIKDSGKKMGAIFGQSVVDEAMLKWQDLKGMCPVEPPDEGDELTDGSGAMFYKDFMKNIDEIDMAKPATTMADSLLSSLKDQRMGYDVVGVLSSGISNQEEDIKGIGADMGNVFGVAVVDAAEDNLKGFLPRLAVLVAPYVEGINGPNRNSSGAIP